MCDVCIDHRKAHAKFCGPLCVSRSTQKERDARWYARHKEREAVRRRSPKSRLYQNAKWHEYMAKKENAVGSFTPAEWQSILKKQNHRCSICNVNGKLSVDHVIPLSRGGCNFAFNLQALCMTCNRKKSNTLPKFAQHSLFDVVANA